MAKRELNNFHTKGAGLMALGIIILIPSVWVAYTNWVYGDICFWIAVPAMLASFTAGSIFMIRGGHVKPIEAEALAIMWCVALAAFIFAAPYSLNRYQGMDYSAAILSASLVIIAFFMVVLNTVNFIAAGDKYNKK